ncbi:MAG: hypothetical protein GXP48_04720 [Acidobacteria bacterium]|nr:hypothetical protein [Acidobacteriota bacterium]
MNERVVRETAAVALLLTAVLLAVALLTYSPLDPSPFHVSTLRESPVNLAGWLGATLAAALFGLVGVAALITPVLAAVGGWKVLHGKRLANPRLTMFGWVLLLAGLPGFVNLVCGDVTFRGAAVSCGGLLGRAVDDLFVGVAGPAGRLVLLLFLVVAGGLLVSGKSVARPVDRWIERWRVARGLRLARRRERRAEKERRKARRRVLERQLSRMDESEGGGPAGLTVKELKGKGKFRIHRKVLSDTDVQSAALDGGEEARSRPKPRKGKRAARSREPASKPVVQEEFDFVEDLEGYTLPSLSFLEPSEVEEQEDSALLLATGKLLTEKCREFKVGGEVVNIRTGPVITTYEFQLDSGVKIAALQNLSEDLALALGTISVRIERIPGRATVGIEVPNRQPKTIRLRALLETDEFRSAPSKLTLSLGVDIRGKPFFADLQRMPHLLIGGSTGAGKSVGINGMVISVLYKAKPDEVKFIMVDPKMVELGVYADIPHLLTPIITDAKKAANALGWAVAEMDGRYKLLAALGVRNLEQYNRLVTDTAQLRKVQERLGDEIDAGAELKPLPYIVIIIDELADLMLTSSRAVEESITRLAQKARAVGVHLICATQRPSVDILTGIIKANFTCRISYRVRSKFDSRTILDAMGAEHLLGSGDMLFLAPGSPTIKRLHGPLVTVKEIATVVRYIKRFGTPEYQRDVLTHRPLGEKKRGGRQSSAQAPGPADDPMYEEAARLVITTGKASASFIQRRLRLGYTRSARLLDMMEAEGLVGPLNGAKGREVLVPKNYFDEVDATHALNGPVDDDVEDT